MLRRDVWVVQFGAISRNISWLNRAPRTYPVAQNYSKLIMFHTYLWLLLFSVLKLVERASDKRAAVVANKCWDTQIDAQINCNWALNKLSRTRIDILILLATAVTAVTVCMYVYSMITSCVCMRACVRWWFAARQSGRRYSCAKVDNGFMSHGKRATNYIILPSISHRLWLTFFFSSLHNNFNINCFRSIEWYCD